MSVIVKSDLKFSIKKKKFCGIQIQIQIWGIHCIMKETVFLLY